MFYENTYTWFDHVWFPPFVLIRKNDLKNATCIVYKRANNVESQTLSLKISKTARVKIKHKSY